VIFNLFFVFMILSFSFFTTLLWFGDFEFFFSNSFGWCLLLCFNFVQHIWYILTTYLLHICLLNLLLFSLFLFCRYLFIIFVILGAGILLIILTLFIYFKSRLIRLIIIGFVIILIVLRSVGWLCNNVLVDTCIIG